MKKIPRVNVTEAAYSAVKQVLLSDAYTPGDRVDIEQLCKDLEVSRTPVFDALNRLEVEGLVEIIPRRGVYLVTLSEEKASELYIAREALEIMVTRLAATNITDKQIEILRKCLSQQGEFLEDAQTEGYASATIKFHNTVVEAAQNKTLERLLNTVYSQMEALRLRTLYLPKRLRKSFAEHQKIFQALVKRDPDLAERVARDHVQATMRYALEILQTARETKDRKKSLADADL